MAEVTSIRPADLRAIETNLGAIHGELAVLGNRVNAVDDRVRGVSNDVKVVYDEVKRLAEDFSDFVGEQRKANRLGQAETRLVQIRQELETKFGHYADVRRTTTGILQADDLGIVRTETISTATEELMLSAPGYWLAPCLVALAAWISDQPELAEKAVREAINRDDEKSSLFWALVCRRADRKQACLKWAQRFLANQDAENLDRNTIIILDAYASGLLGADSEGVVSRQMAEWLEHLADKPGFVEQQTDQWSPAILLKKKPVSTSYRYLQKYSQTWPALQTILEGAYLHAEILQYFTNIFAQQDSTEPLKAQLDEILTSLVTDFDDEELPLRRKERFEQFVVDYEGDEARAKQSMAVEQSALEAKKDFTQLLTDAAMKPESTHASASTQKFAIALSKEWILDAYRDVVAQNRMLIPDEIELTLGSFQDKTTDGGNEVGILQRFRMYLDKEKDRALSQQVLTAFDKYSLYAGGVIALIGLIMVIMGSMFLGLIAIVAGAGLSLHSYSKSKAVEAQRQKIEQHYRVEFEDGSQIIRAFLAEVVDFRAEFAAKDAESEQVIAFLEQISPDQYVRKLDANRRIKL
jgi:hypothetical protein